MHFTIVTSLAFFLAITGPASAVCYSKGTAYSEGAVVRFCSRINSWGCSEYSCHRCMKDGGWSTAYRCLRSGKRTRR